MLPINKELQSNELYFDQLYFEKIKNLEESITLVQTAIHNNRHILLLLQELSQSLKYKLTQSPVDELIEEANFDINQCFAGINLIVDKTLFKDQIIFNGEYAPSTSSNTALVEIVRVLNTVNSDQSLRYELVIENKPSKAFILGDVALTDAHLRAEETIVIYYQDKFVQYKMSNDETVDSFIRRLQLTLDQEMLSIDVSVDQHDRLCLTHKQFGSKFHFRAQSLKTAIISQEIGTIKNSLAGSDIQGKLNGIECIGNGRFLISKNDEHTLSGIIFYIFQDCKINQPIEIIVDKQKTCVYVDDCNKEFLIIPQISLKNLARGVDNKSNFKNLSEIKLIDSNQIADALLMIHWAIEELNFLNDIWIDKEKKIIKNILNLIKKSTLKDTNSMLASSFDEVKAKNMSDFLRTRLIQRKENNKNQQNYFV